MMAVKVGEVTIGGGDLVLIAGPCIIESREHAYEMAAALKEITARLRVPFIFKASFDKANRSSIDGFRGPGLKEGLAILSGIKVDLDIPITTDIHEPSQANRAARVLDLLQIPAFLCRQTDLLLAAGAAGKPVNIKKGQFMAPWDMLNAVKKVESTGNKAVLLTERGASFGYNNLVCDLRSLGIMRTFGKPVVFDVTHSLQLPGGRGASSGGNREFIAPLARAGVAFGVDALFMEVHDRPEAALSDGPNSLRLIDLEPLLKQVVAIHRIVA
jgi:2-dehydro-3-deoxyphosphooctonate aldolase (KDO 8-P synthase)